MKNSVAMNRPAPNKEMPGEPTDRLAHLAEAVEHAAHLLPAQGPITVFIHHNTLHAFEDLPFERAVRKGAEVFGCRAFLPEPRYRDELRKGRIRFADLRAVLRDDLGKRADEPILKLGPRLELRLAMLEHPVRSGTTEELRWLIAESDALRRVRQEASPVARARLVADTRHWAMRDRPAALSALVRRFGEANIEAWTEETWEAFAVEALWDVCVEGVGGQPALAAPPGPSRHRDLLLAVAGVDTDALVNDLLIRFCASFLDQGVAHWPLPGRERGFLASFCSLYRLPAGPPSRWLAGLPAELARVQDGGMTALECVAESLDALGVAEEEWDDYLSRTLLALRGWAGMMRQVETRGDRVAHPAPEGSLLEYVAVRLLLERFALAHVAREELGYRGPLTGLRAEAGRLCPPLPPVGAEARAFLAFQVSQLLGWSARDLHGLGRVGWGALLGELEAFGVEERERVFHLAYERRFRVRTLDAVAIHNRDWKGVPAGRPRPRFQAVFCLDEREESMRRHIEELAPDAETLSTAGFFAVAMYYRGAEDAHFVPLCPVVIRPGHWVTEEARAGQEEVHTRQTQVMRVIGSATHHIHVGSRTAAFGAVLAAVFGPLATVPLIARILFPRLTARLTRMFGRFVRTPPATRLTLTRAGAQPGQELSQLGFSLDEKAAIGERVLRDMGCHDRLARLVLLVGHGSSSMNNPHKSAYDCGACGGSVGGPNARALATILNDPPVRDRLAQRGIVIPADAVFVGGWHNTCSDAVTFLDLDRVPPSHAEELEAALRVVNEACARNAHERCRRFMSAPLTQTFAAAHRHVEARSEDLAQTRPELGHATNAICYVGRRERTRGLFFDRRAFLTSYDSTKDEDSAVLLRTMQALVPVCGGINLEYYFSHTDCPGWGCGSKLPHNISALLGVMDGAASDLRTGLPWQMVEIHEPVRLLFVLETTPEVVFRLMERDANIGRAIRNSWVQVAVLDPNSAGLKLYKNGTFEPYQPEATDLPRAASSLDWYRGWRDHLEFAVIGGGNG